GSAAMAKRDYLVEAAKQIHMALDSEVNEDYEAAFSYYKNGVDLLLNGVQLDPNKERREAVKRKTTQYLKRAEEIFITHLQDNLGKGSGYSSLRFRPIRHLSSPVEDLEMCKVVGVSDKVLVVQSMVNKETFVVKSLVKSSWESRDQPTIIPQGVPYMVKLLRYYVSEDAVYLHLEHIKGDLKPITLYKFLISISLIVILGGRLFSKLHKLRHEKAKEHPECTFPGQHHTRMKTSHTSPAISTDYQHNHNGGQGGRASHSPNTDPTEADFMHRVDNCRTHSYIEETGCLQNTRSSFFTNLDRLSLHSGPSKTQLSAHIHPPAPSLYLQSGKAAAAQCWGLPEAEVRVWGAQVLLALESLHEQGIICKDLNPRNILLTFNGKVCLTFFGQWSEVQTEICTKAMEQMYCAPEIGGVSRVTEACDWWSLGALLFELLTGMPLWQLHPAGIHSHTQLLIPEHLSAAAASLLTELLQYDAGYRLGSGGGGVSDIKCHPFFSAISWKALSC
uniref:Protein kinase domain-containing protein n=1 Tax=Periophthalmus magnuspinnatus TaxID=409849 RepID=A0A3B4B2A9_9GOBI